jgi:bifunctional non-homologous end joining protein LigD
MTLADQDQRDTGLRAQLLNPIPEEEAASYLANPAWCAQEKFDGKRMILRKAGNTITAANRHGLSTGFPAAVEAQLAERPQNFVIDGESVGEKFYAFDLLELDGKDLRGDAYLERLTALYKLFPLPGCIIPAETVLGGEKTGFLAQLKAGGNEGVVSRTWRHPGPSAALPAAAVP